MFLRQSHLTEIAIFTHDYSLFGGGMKYLIGSVLLFVSLNLFSGEKEVPMSTIEQEKCVSIVYTNYRGETATRTIVPESVYFGSTDWHPEKQWLLRAYDVEKQAYRDFAMKDIASWKP